MVKNGYLLIVLLVFFFFYFFLFPMKVGEELIISPHMKIEPDRADAPLSTGDPEIALWSRKALAYLDKDFNPVRIIPSPGRAALSSHYYVTETEEGVLQLGSRRTDETLLLSTELTPLLFDDHIYLADLYSGYLREIDISGRTKWEYHFSSLITTLDGKNGAILIGLLNGDLVMLDQNGRVKMSWTAGGSRVRAIYGAAMSPDGETIALVSGLDPQRFILLENKENGYRPVFHENLAQSFRKPVSIDFTHPHKVVIEGVDQGLFYSRDQTELKPFPLPGEYVSARYLEEDGNLVFAFRRDRGGGISSFTEDGHLLFQLYFDEEPRDLQWDGSRLLITGSEKSYVLERGFR